MSDEKLPAEMPSSDFTEQDLKRLDLFVKAGSPGFNLADEARITKMLDLYLSGKTYRQIAMIMRIQKELVLLYSRELSWYPIKVAYLQELHSDMQNRTLQAKLQSQDFLLQLTQMWQKKIGQKIEKYLQTGDESESEKISLKEVDKYLKTLEALAKLSSDPTPKKGDSPAIGLNLGDGVTIKKTGNNSVEITPKQKSVASMLEILANQRRESEAAAKNDSAKESYDINQENPNKKQGENGHEES